MTKAFYSKSCMFNTGYSLSKEKPVILQTLFVLLIVSLSVLLWGCSVQEWITEDTTYLTPIPQATLLAFRDGMPIENKLQAVIAAQVNLQTTHLHFDELPEVILVEKISLEDAHQKVHQPQPGDYFFEDRPGNTKVWLVLFEGECIILHPDLNHTYTPEPLSHGCAYVIVDSKNDGRTEMGTIKCPH